MGFAETPSEDLSTRSSQSSSVFRRGSLPLFSSCCQYRRPGLNAPCNVNVMVYFDSLDISPVDALLDDEGSELHVFSPFTTVNVRDYADFRKSVVFMKVLGPKNSDNDIHTLIFSGENASKDCCKFVAAVRKSLAEVALSLFPTHRISVLPVDGVELTARRIMAGYMLLQKGYRKNSIVYAELTSPMNGEAAVQIYTDHHCTSLVDSFAVTKSTTLLSHVEVGSSIFEVNKRRFCARTISEGKLWARALDNIRALLLFEAPEPDEDRLAVFRSAVSEQVDQLKISRRCAPLILPLNGDCDQVYPAEDVSPRPIASLLSAVPSQKQEFLFSSFTTPLEGHPEPKQRAWSSWSWGGIWDKSLLPNMAEKVFKSASAWGGPLTWVGFG